MLIQHLGFVVYKNTISLLVGEAILAKNASEVITTPSTPAEWKAKGNLSSHRWQFHNTVRALDGKHVAIARPAGGDSMFYNNKN